MQVLGEFVGLEELIVVIPYRLKMGLSLLYHVPLKPPPDKREVVLDDFGVGISSTYGAVKNALIEAFRTENARWDGSVEGGKDLVVRFEYELIEKKDMMAPKTTRSYRVRRL